MHVPVERRGRLLYGGDYNPEQWDESVWLEDARLMREARVNLATVGVFAWSRIQPSPGSFDVRWLDRVLDMLHEHDVDVDLATATATPPPWLTNRHPEALARTADGHVRERTAAQPPCRHQALISRRQCLLLRHET
jgi:beta-galactosidase